MNEFEKLRQNMEHILSQFENSDNVSSSEIDEVMSMFNNNDIDGLYSKNINRLSLNFNKIDNNVVTPKYEYQSDSGFDLRSTIDINMEPFSRALIPTGLRFNIPDGYEIQVRPKSGLALNYGLTVLNTPGTVDSGYNAEVKVILFNTSDVSVKIEKGMKIAQAVLSPVVNGKWVELIEVDDIESKDRNNNGFGSTKLF